MEARNKEIIQESYVPFEQAKSLKELGFPQELHPFPCQYHEVTGQMVYCQDCLMKEYIVMPTLSLVQKWLREEWGCIVSIEYDDKHFYWITNIYYMVGDTYGYYQSFDTYEEALLAGINKCIETLKTSNNS